MNLSEALNFAVKKIVEQGGQCMFGSSCYYGKGTRHCAVGWLLDHENLDLMECGKAVESLCDVFGEVIPEVIRHNILAFVRLQQFHDSNRKCQRKRSFMDLKALHPEVDYSGDHWETWINMGLS